MRLSVFSVIGTSFFLLSFMTLQDIRKAENLQDLIEQENYRTFPRPPGFEKRVPSTIPHEIEAGIKVDIYMNGVIEKALNENESLKEWPVGSVMVKEGFIDGKQVVTAAMWKTEGGWFWVQWNAAGLELTAGHPQFCVSCHSLGDDMLRAIKLPTK